MSSPQTETPTIIEPVMGLRASLVRQTLEFLVILTVGILLIRTFTAEAYVVPTGSMAPTLLGNHEEVVCSSCSMRFALGLAEDGQAEEAICPNCGEVAPDDRVRVPCSGDRLLVQKGLFDLRQPRRWEVAVFQFPGDPTQAYVKRVVGLPGESVRIFGGDVYIDGRVARKSLQEQQAIRILVYDSQYTTGNSTRVPRFQFVKGPVWASNSLPTGWQIQEGQLHFEAQPTGPLDREALNQPSRHQVAGIDWAEYRHRDPDRGRYTPVYDFNAYNGKALRGENRVTDLMVEIDLKARSDVPIVYLRLSFGSERFLVSLPIGAGGWATLKRNGRSIETTNPVAIEATTATSPSTHKLEASVMDRRLIVAWNGVPLFDPIDYDDPSPTYPSYDTPFAIGASDGSLTVTRVKLYRDVYYTSVLTGAPRRAFGVDQPYHLGENEFFVLGDNSAVSNDSRFWGPSPVVKRDLFLGKPFLVHLPGQMVPLEVFGRSVYWVPDPREIRYIR